MAKDAKKRVVFISSFPPRKCGIATFTADLIRNVDAAASGEFEPLVVTVRPDNSLRYIDPVKFEIRQNVRSDYICAADYINFSHVDMVSVQHEFGLFGGPAGAYLGLLLKRLKVPVLTTLHTILAEPKPDYHRVMVDVCDCSCRVITMNEQGVKMLQDVYEVPAKRIRLIPHGIPDLPFVDSNYYKGKFGLEGRRMILTFGLISKNKGIEIMLRALPRIVAAEPSVVYLVLGMTHPSVLRADGESYRFELQQLVKDLNLQNHVIFHNRFVNDEELHNFLCAADLYVTPYLNQEQLTSGTLAFAVGAGKAVISTPYRAAAELLAENRGVLVPAGDPDRLAEAVVGILRDDALFYTLRRKAYDYGRTRIWPKIGQSYWRLFSDVRLPIHLVCKSTLLVAESMSNIEVPEPALEHLAKLTDDTGLFQHAPAGVHSEIPLWVVLACHAAMGLGTMTGGWRIVRTMGMRITKLAPTGGFCAETSGAASLFLATGLGVPVSTTHTITGAIVGTGSVRKFSAVRWGVAGRIVWAWVLTIPGSAAIGGGAYLAARAMGIPA